jgi:hypothetical protein
VIQIFSKNWFVFTLLLFPYALLVRIWIFFGVPSNWPYDTENLSLIYRYVEQFFPTNYLWNVILATVLIFINAAQINYIVIKNRIARDINLYAGMVFILLSALHKDMFWLSPQLISLSFILAALNNLFRIYQKPRSAGFLFNAGFFTGLATLFYFPFSLFLFFAIISILILRKFDIREIIQLLTGFFLVFFFMAFIRYWNDLNFNFVEIFLSQFKWSFSFSRYSLNEWIILAFTVLMLFISSTNYRKFTIKKSIQSQKKVNLVYWLMIIGFLTLPFIPTVFIFPSLLVIYVSYAIFIGMMMTRSKNQAAMELLHLFILFFIIFSHFWF